MRVRAGPLFQVPAAGLDACSAGTPGSFRSGPKHRLAVTRRTGVPVIPPNADRHSGCHGSQSSPAAAHRLSGAYCLPSTFPSRDCSLSRLNLSRPISIKRSYSGAPVGSLAASIKAPKISARSPIKQSGSHDKPTQLELLPGLLVLARPSIITCRSGGDIARKPPAIPINVSMIPPAIAIPNTTPRIRPTTPRQTTTTIETAMHSRNALTLCQQHNNTPCPPDGICGLPSVRGGALPNFPKFVYSEKQPPALVTAKSPCHSFVTR